MAVHNAVLEEPAAVLYEVFLQPALVFGMAARVLHQAESVGEALEPSLALA